MGTRIGVIVIGVGRYGFRAHFPVILKLAKAGDLKLIALVDFEKRDNHAIYEKHEGKIENYLAENKEVLGEPWIFAPPEWKSSPPTRDQVAEFLNVVIPADRLRQEFDVIAVVVSTSPTARLPYLEWAVDRRYHILADKPLTVPVGLAVGANTFSSISEDYERLNKKCANKKLLFVLATQKRYSDAFTQVAKHIRDIKLLEVPGKTVPVTSITYETNDGYWMLAKDEYQERFVGPYGSSRFAYASSGGGGKVTHTGYHILDIIPWLIRHSNPEEINNAVVYASFWRPQDSFSAFPLQRDREGNFNLVPKQDHEDRMCGLAGLSEVNAQIQIAFRFNNQKRCQVSMNLLHEGITGNRKLDASSRVKYEQMNLHQGPAAAVSLCRLARLNPAANANDRGGDGHLELLLFRNTELVGGEPLMETRPKEEDDTLPAEDFFKALVTTSPGLAQMVSPLSDHSIGVHLMAAIYESAVSDLTTGLPTPVRIDLEPESWGPPVLYANP